MSEAWVGESGSTPNRWSASFVSRPRTRVRASLVNHVGTFTFVCTILRCEGGRGEVEAGVRQRGEAAGVRRRQRRW